MPIGKTEVRADRSTTQWLFAGYYAATVAFVLFDYLLDLNLRLAFLDGMPGWRALYYVFCAGCFVLIWRYPAWSKSVAAFESLITVSSLIITMGLKVYVPTDLMIEEGRGVVTPSEMFNFLISGSAAYLALMTRSEAARKELRRNLSSDD